MHCLQRRMLSPWQGLFQLNSVSRSHAFATFSDTAACLAAKASVEQRRTVRVSLSADPKAKQRRVPVAYQCRFMWFRTDGRPVLTQASRRAMAAAVAKAQVQGDAWDEPVVSGGENEDWEALPEEQAVAAPTATVLPSAAKPPIAVDKNPFALLDQ